MTSACGKSLCVVALDICVSQIDHSKAAGDMEVLFLFLFMCFFPLRFLGADFLYVTEEAPDKRHQKQRHQHHDAVPRPRLQELNKTDIIQT